MFNKERYLLAFMLSFSFLATMNVEAQEEDADVEEVVTTGSRIKSNDFELNSPVASLGADQINVTNTINIESLLNQLPQIVPGSDRSSNNPGSGTATVNLRGLGSTRTLVLLNGKRMVPSSQGGTIDLNNIPTSLVKRVDVLTGGASAVYGADAVAGVVNFILKDDFEGMELNVGYEMTTEYQDAEIFQADVTMGANTADGKGNVVFNVSHTDRASLYQGDRSYTTFSNFDDGEGNIYNGGSSGGPNTNIFAGAVGADSTLGCSSSGATFNADGSIRCFDNSEGDNNDYFNYAPFNYLQLPQTRNQMTAMGHYEISDTMRVYANANFTSSNVPQELAPTPIFQSGTTFTIDSNPFLPTGTQAILSEAFGDGVDTDADGIDDTGTAYVRRRMVEVGSRIADSNYQTHQFTLGVDGTLANGMSYDAFYSDGWMSGSETQYGNVNRDRFKQALQVTDANTCTDTSGGCVPMNMWGAGNISAGAAAFVSTRVAAAYDYHLKTMGATLSGDTGYDLPGGDVLFVAGWEKRSEDADYRPSQDLATGQIAGFNGSPASGGGFDVDEFFGELSLPITDALRGSVAYRDSDYSSFGNKGTYRVDMGYTVNEMVKLRTSYNFAVRAPSISGLYSPAGENFPSASDPCSSKASDTSEAVKAICIATGVPSSEVFSPSIDLAAGQVRSLTGGNANLTPEEADTYTVGVVVTDLVPGLTFSVDYFDIEIANVIAAFGGGASNVLNTCYSATAANGGIGSQFCNVIERRADGTIDYVSLKAQNNASQTKVGWDLLASYDTNIMGKEVAFNLVGSLAEEDVFVAFAGDTPITCAGEFGNDCGEPQPEWAHRLTAVTDVAGGSVQVTWRHIGKSNDDGSLGYTLYRSTLGAENYVDVSWSAPLGDNGSWTVGLDNAFDVDVPIFGDNQEQANTYPATYDVYGRTIFLKYSLKF
jgi:outer membrane cobalamin receptor|tara:strand:+ start:144 stop:2954 length:2811 start_codon:yes stop_codon:yes gene_type:complete